jgi:hypothetical protein
MTATEYIEVIHRDLPFPTFDSDNHLYETQDALTKFLPPEYQGVIRYVDIGARPSSRSRTASPTTSRIPRSTASRCRAVRDTTSRRAAATAT